MMDKKFAEHLARDWIESWNAHDLERILWHYADDLKCHRRSSFASPMNLVPYHFGRHTGGLRRVTDIKQEDMH